MIPDNLKPYLSNKDLFLKALTHRSYCNEHPKAENNERLEFLGDAVLEYLMSKELFKRFPKEPEGVLTAMRSKLVQTKSLYNVAQKLDLGPHLRLSKGEEKSGGRENPALLENAVEALIGAIYMDQGMSNARKFLGEFLFPEIENLSTDNLKDPKSLFQELVQSEGMSTPTYEVVDEEGPDHDKVFTVTLMVDGEEWGRGTGPSKQKAQTAAAKAGLLRLEESSKK